MSIQASSLKWPSRRGVLGLLGLALTVGGGAAWAQSTGSNTVKLIERVMPDGDAIATREAAAL